MVTKRKRRWGRTNWEFGISRYKLNITYKIYKYYMKYIKIIYKLLYINKVLLYNIGNYIQHPVINNRK